MKNKFSANRPVVASTLRRGSERLIGGNGEMNADSKKDLLAAIATLVEAGANSSVISENDAISREETAATNREMVLAAFDDKEELAALGDLMSDQIKIAADRDGFMRRFLRHQDIGQGEIPKVSIVTKNVTASVSTGPVQTQTQMVRDNEVYPAEFYITARPYIEQKDIARSSSDILEQKYLDAVEAVMVQEDRSLLKMADDLIGLDNEHVVFSGGFTPTAFAELSSSVTNWGISPGSMLIASNLWADITTKSEWQAVLDPVSQHEVLLTGKLAYVHGVPMVSDHFRHEQHKVLNAGDVYMFGSPNQVGQYTDRDGIVSQAIDVTHEKVPGRGWVMSELLSMVIANSRAIARGNRA